MTFGKDFRSLCYGGNVVDLSKLTHADFEQYLHQAFHVYIPTLDPIDVELHKVGQLGPRTSAEAEADGRRQPFSLVFLGPSSNQYLAQAMYTVEHEQLGKLMLFLVPLGPTPEGRMRYEAVFT
jgi:hypothetical protein